MFDGAQLELLRNAIVLAFNPDSLQQLLRFKLGKVLYEIVSPLKGFRDQVFDLLQRAEEEGWTKVLVVVIAAARPDNENVTTFVNENARWALDVPKPGDLSAKLKTGLTSVIERKSESGVQRVLYQFRNDLQAARDGVRMLDQYKKLHELLHSLQVMMPQRLEEAADESRAGAQTASLDLYAYQIRQSAAKARVEADSLPTSTLELAWAATLDRVALLVEAGSLGKPEPLDRAVLLLRTVLSEAARINSRMTDVVRELHLDGLVEALKKIREYFQGTPAETDVATALDGLASLQPRLSGLMQEHYEWQIIDKAFGVAEVMPGASLTERFLEWTDTQTRLKNLFELAPNQPWAEMLRKLIGTLEAAEAAHDDVRFERAFDSFRIVARDRFLEVDTQLLERSGHLATVAPVLDKLL